MKKLVLLTALCFVALASRAQVALEKSQTGDYRVALEAVTQWEGVDIIAEEAALGYIDSFPKAIANPNQPLLVQESERFLKLRPAFKARYSIKEGFIVYDERAKKIGFQYLKAIEDRNSYVILWSLAAVILMLLSNTLSNKNFRIWRTIFSLLAALFVGISIVAVGVLGGFGYFSNSIISIPGFAVIFACAAAIVAGTFSYISGTKNYAIASMIFYVAIAVHLLALFI